MRLSAPSSIERAVVRALGRRMWFAALQRPCEDERDPVEVAVGKNGVAKIGPAVAHQVGALEQIGGVAEAERVAELVERHPPDVLGTVRIAIKAWRQIRADEDIWTSMVAADRISTEDNTARMGYEVDDYVRSPVLAWHRAGDIGESDQAVKAIAKRFIPGRNGIVYRPELLARRLGVSLDGDGQMSMVPPVTGIVVTQDLERVRIGFGVVASRAVAPRCGARPGGCGKRPHERNHECGWDGGPMDMEAPSLSVAQLEWSNGTRRAG